MTSISAASASTYQSPLQKLQDELQSEVSSGAISSTDQDALSSALTDIDFSIQSSRASDQSSGSKPGDIKSKIDDLISSEVSSGKLTSDQATELQGVFKAAFANGPGGAGGDASAPAVRVVPAAPVVRPRGPPRVAPVAPIGHHGGGSKSGDSSSSDSSSSVERDQFGQRPAAAVPAVAAGCGEQLVVDFLQLDRQHQLVEQHQLVALGAADRLPELTSF